MPPARRSKSSSPRPKSARKPAGAKAIGPADKRLVKAMGHPLRFDILLALNQGVASPNELAAKLDERLNVVAYHVRILDDLGAIELVREEPRRGAIEHYYRATMRPLFEDREWATVPLATRRAIFEQLSKQIFRDVRAAQQAGGFDHLEAHVSWTKFDLDEQAFSELAGEVMGLLERAFELQAESDGRRAKSTPPPATIETELAMLQFEPARPKRKPRSEPS
jgi:DNA-binding transcriptional ArsR family regulator